MKHTLYHQAIKDLARSRHAPERLVAPNATAELSNAFCGDRILIELRLQDARIVEAAHQTRGCMLCCASAELLVGQVAGMTEHDVNAAHDLFVHYLNGLAELPDAWFEWTTFQPVRSVPSRHGCVLLPFAALQQAYRQGSK